MDGNTTPPRRKKLSCAAHNKLIQEYLTNADTLELSLSEWLEQKRDLVAREIDKVEIDLAVDMLVQTCVDQRKQSVIFEGSGLSICKIFLN